MGNFSHSGVNHGFKGLIVTTRRLGRGTAILTNIDRGDQVFEPIQRAVNDALNQR
ncbi:MAG: hypothetical protein U1A77_13985 [Pirellulales bacterium]